MFLVRGDMNHEAAWTQWIANVGNILPPSISCSEQVSACYSQLLDSQKPVRSVYDEQTFFTIYVHTKPVYPGYKNGSIFDGRIVEPRVEVQLSPPLSFHALH